MTCDEFRGACCEELTTPSRWQCLAVPWVREWLLARGLSPATVAGDCRMVLRCPQLTPEGRCAIEDSKPLVCRVLQEGGAACLEVNARRRPLHFPCQSPILK